MSLLLLLLLVLPLSNCEFSNETVKDDLEETMYKKEKVGGIEDKVEELEKKLDTKNMEVENLQKRLTELTEEVMKMKNQKQDVARLKHEVRTEVRKQVEQVEQELKELPYEMVCAYCNYCNWENDIVSYDNITVELNNSDQEGGADGTMNIETGVFTAVTSGYYIVTFVLQRLCQSRYFLLHRNVSLPQWSRSGGKWVADGFVRGKQCRGLHLGPGFLISGT